METIDMSGFGGGYEATCQKMLINGLKYLNENPEFTWEGSYGGFKNVYGVLIPRNNDAELLDKALQIDIPDCLGATGAMHQCVVGHLMAISRYGLDGWIARIAKKEPERIYEVDEEKLNTILAIEAIEFQLKLDSGYDFLAELKKSIPEENWIMFDPENPKLAFQEWKRRLGCRDDE